MKYDVTFCVDVEVDNVEKIINYVDQGWGTGRSDNAKSMTITLRKFVIIEADNDERFKMYAKMLNAIAGIDQYIEEAYNLDTKELIREVYN